MIFSAGTAFRDVTAGATQPIFQGAIPLRRERATRAAHVEAEEHYRSTLLTAFQSCRHAACARTGCRRSQSCGRKRCRQSDARSDQPTTAGRLGQLSHPVGRLISNSRLIECRLSPTVMPTQPHCFRHWRWMVEPSRCAERQSCAEPSTEAVARNGIRSLGGLPGFTCRTRSSPLRRPS